LRNRGRLKEVDGMNIKLTLGRSSRKKSAEKMAKLGIEKRQALERAALSPITTTGVKREKKKRT